MKQMTDSLKWRYAVKKYDPSRKVSGDDIVRLKEAIQLAPSSQGLQPYRVLFIEDKLVRAELLTASHNQSQVTEASHLVVFAIENNLGDGYIDNYFENIIRTRNVPLEGSLLHHKQAVAAMVNRMPAGEKKDWATRQAYLALGFLLFAAAGLRIDANPMEGFMPAQYDAILGLDKLGLSAVVIAAVGYRHKEDHFQHFAKVRKPAAELFLTL